MADEIVKGLPELKAALLGVAPKLRVRALRIALTAGARLVQRAAKANAPVLSPTAPAVIKGIRKPGVVRRAISVRSSKTARAAGNVGVFVNVRPAKGARYKTASQFKAFGVKVRTRYKVRSSQRGTVNDPWYWYFLEKGTKRMRAAHFLQRSASALPAALEAFIKSIKPAIEKLNRPKAPAP